MLTSKVFQKIVISGLMGLIFLATAQAQDKPRPGEKAYGGVPKNTCQWGEGSPYEAGCTGMIGLLRLSKEALGSYPFVRKQKSQILFGSPELPAVGTEVTLKRSAHLRTEYWPERDDQTFNLSEKICNETSCWNNWRKKQSHCGNTVGQWSFSAGTMEDQIKKSRRYTITCPGPTDGTEYLAAGTVVKVMGYQLMGQLFILVQVVKIESVYPLDDEKKYPFDRREII